MLVVCSSTQWPAPWPFTSAKVLGLKRVMPKPLLEAHAPWSGSHEGPRSQRKCFSGHAHSFSYLSGVREAGEMRKLGPGLPEAVLVVYSLTWWPVPWPFASSMKLGLKRVMPKPLLEADAPWGGASEGPRS